MEQEPTVKLHSSRHLLYLLTLSFAASCDVPEDTERAPEQAPEQSLESIFTVGGDAELAEAEERSLTVLDALPDAEELGEWEVKKVWVDELSMAHTRIQQTFHGIPVFEGEAIVHLHSTGEVRGLTDKLLRNISVDTNPDYLEDEAIDLAAVAWQGWDVLTDDPKAELWILRHEGVDHLVWRVDLLRMDGTPQTASQRMFIDAHTGEVVWQLNNLHDAAVTGSGDGNYHSGVSLETWEDTGTYYLDDTTRSIGTYTFNNTTSSLYYLTDADNVWDTASAAEGVDVHYAAMQAYDYYDTQHGRTGLDGSGGPGWISSLSGTGTNISMLVNYSTNYANAYYDPTGPYFIFGDGDGTFFDALTTVDIVSHEMTHAVTGSEANFTYSNQSGAMDESMADVFGAMVEAYTDGAISADTWLMGEECYTPSTAGDALRYMDDPTADGSSFDHYNDLYTGFQDSGGVHWNSGIGNMSFYLLSQGGTHPTYGGSMTGIGSDEAAAIWYHALVTYMTSSTTFADARDAMLSAATDLYGASSVEYAAVENAWYLVGVGDAASGNDADGDGYDDINAGGDDCDDTDAAVNPGAAEVCDGVDNNCDGTIDESTATDASTWYTDADSDGYGDAASSSVACDAPSGAVADSTDCDDTNAAVNPGAAEVCDSIDNDCDGTADNNATDATTWYADSDGDTYGDAATTQDSCDQPSGYLTHILTRATTPLE